MEATEEQGLLSKIKPPKLEDAGLEDCALAPELIKQAFIKAANTIRSSLLGGSDPTECLEDPDPTNGNLEDSLLGVPPVSDLPGHCGNEKGVPQGLDDKVVDGTVDDEVEGSVEAEDNKVFGDVEKEDEGNSCVDGLKGLKIGDSESEKDEEEKEDEDEKPILVEAYV